MAREDEIVKERIKKIEEMRKLGVEPYPHKFEKKDSAQNLQNEYKKLANEKFGKKATVAGRIMSIRDIGKIIFAVMQDGSGKIQIVLQEKQTPEKQIELFKKFADTGDFLGIEGKVFRTKRGELSVLAEKVKILTKSLKPLPEKFHGLQDKEERYRKRYLDLITSPEVKEVFDKREKIIDSIREFLKSKNFREVDTPYLQTIYGGAAAKPFKTHLNALDIDLFLAISPELYLKRLIVGGYEKVFTIARNFRNEGIDRWHNPEFTMMEIYWAHADYNDMMELFEQIFEYACKKVNGTTKIKFKEKEIDFKAPWKRMKMTEAIKKFVKIDVEKMPPKELADFAEKNGVELKGDTWGWLVQSIFEHFCEPRIEQPTFIIDHPMETTPLCKLHRDDPSCRLIERFEPFCMGTELGNAYSELNDPVMQRRLLEEQQNLLKKGNEEANPFDEDFVNAIEIGMPPTGGLGLGIDRMIMLLTNQESIRDVILFPFMKPEVKEDEKSVNPDSKKKDSKVIISPEARNLGLKTSYAIIKDVEIKKSDKELDKLKKEIKLNPNEKRIKCMQDAFKSFGTDPEKRAPSSEALIKRLKEKKSLYSINTLVDSYNISSIKESLPMAAYDLSKVNFPITLRNAKKAEEITLIGGEKKKIKEGEIVYSDSSDILCLDFNYRDCDKTKITENTKDVIIFVDGCSGIDDHELIKALDSASELIVRFNGGKVVEKNLIK